jgi:hypothetical protein
MQAATERMQRGYLQRDSSPRGRGPWRGSPAAVRGVLEILGVKERSPRSIGNVAKQDCIFLTPNTVGLRTVINTGATSGAGPRRGPCPKLQITLPITIQNKREFRLS